MLTNLPVLYDFCRFMSNYRGVQGRHCPTLAGMARVETPVSFAHLISFLAIFSCFLPLCHRILPIVSPVFEICKTPGMAIAIPAIPVSPPLCGEPFLPRIDIILIQRYFPILSLFGALNIYFLLVSRGEASFISL